jgi:2-polyprenyl-3-methyl-5-hydroxy-6-metoxy-1,4-benzoquinol methylase
MAPPGPVLDVHAGVDITELGGRYAAIVFWQSLGRVPEPRTALEHAAALLKPAGLLTVAEPAAGLPALTERLRGGAAASAQRVRIPQQALVERLRALGLEVLHADRAGTGVASWPATLLGGVAAVQARR